MFAIEPAGSDAISGFGLGFSINRFAGRRTVSHNGAVYGFASALVGLPEEKLGVVVLNDVDCANGFDEKVLRKALGLMLNRKIGAAVPPLPEPVDSRPSGSTSTPATSRGRGARPASSSRTERSAGGSSASRRTSSPSARTRF